MDHPSKCRQMENGKQQNIITKQKVIPGWFCERIVEFFGAAVTKYKHGSCFRCYCWCFTSCQFLSLALLLYVKCMQNICTCVSVFLVFAWSNSTAPPSRSTEFALENTGTKIETRKREGIISWESTTKW